jgi:membrane protease YdiL (CAAX protease family)
MLETKRAPWRVRDFLGAMAGGLLAAVLAGLLTGGASPSVFLVTGAVAQYAGHLAVIWLQTRSRGGWESLGFRVEGRDSLWVLAGVALQVTLPLLLLPLADLIADGEGGQVIGDEIRALDSTSARLTLALVIALLAPVTEELLFRGILLQAVLPSRPRSAPWIVAAVFAIFHVFGLAGDLLRALILTMPVFFVVGLILANMTLRRGRLGPAIFLHAGFNLLGILLLLLPEELVDEALRQVSTTTTGGG